MTDDLYAPPDTPLTVLHRDRAILVVDKPSGLLSVPGKGEHLADCLIARVQACIPRRCSSTGSTATPRA
jgi:tRNA pseudouridine32 synthase / 23S rRNA pseudouridine746 synthase